MRSVIVSQKADQVARLALPQVCGRLSLLLRNSARDPSIRRYEVTAPMGSSPALPCEQIQVSTDYASLGVSASPSELLDGRGGEGQAHGPEEATGSPPLSVDLAFGQTVVLNDDVSPGQYARFMRRTSEQVLVDTERAYQSCKRRMARDGGVVLSSIHFTCSVRPDRVEVSVGFRWATSRAVDGWLLFVNLLNIGFG